MNTGEQAHLPTQLVELVGQRYEFLALLKTSTYDKRAIVAKLDVSRSTVDRALRNLQTADLIERTAEGYRTTLYGSTLLAIYDTLINYVDHVQRAHALLAELPPELEFSLSLVIDADVVVATEPVLHAPATRIGDLVSKATEFQGLAYAHTSPEAVEIFQRRVFEHGMETEIVFREAMYENFKTAHPTVAESLHAAENCTAYVATDVPFGLFLLTIDGTEYVCLIVYGADHNLKGIIVNDTTEAVAWGTRLFERYRTRATPLPRE